MSSAAALAGHLHTLGEEELAELIAIRRDVAFEPAPKSVDQLTERLLHPSSMTAAAILLNLPELQVVEAAAALGDGCTTVRLAALLGVADDDPDLGAAVRRLIELALIWPHEGALAAGHLDEIWSHPLDLGSRAADLLTTRAMNELRKLATLYDIPVTGRGKDEVVTALASWLARPENVRRLAAEAPADVRDQLVTLASQPVTSFGPPGMMFGSPGMVLPWAIDHGLLIRSGWNVTEMPREVALALRDGYTAPFDPRPPAITLSPIAPDAAERDAAAAAAEILAAITAVVTAMSSGPVPLLKTGGLGVRELRRIAKLSGQDEDGTRLTVELLAAGGLIEASEDGLTPSTTYDEFAAAEPADQLLDVIDDWLAMPASPLAPADSTATSRLLSWDEEEELMLTGLRAVILRALHTAVPEGQAADPGTLAPRLSWASPVLADQADEDLPRYVTGIWREAHRLGLLALGTMTGLGHARLSKDPDVARRRAEAMLPRPRDTVLLQNDLTAVVTGTPSAGLLTLLDRAATPESRSGAWTWRFSPASIRSALDAGDTRDELSARIAEVAEGGRVPQALTYLIDDVARRHGQVKVRPTGCCLCSDDETLLTEILQTRSLHALRLVRLAPTVLASGKPQAETLTALRMAGYAPAALGADGRPAIEIPRRRAVPQPVEDDIEEMPAPLHPGKVARMVLGAR
ncbi:helicase-associated domain-containing protein [Paractinoplanes maris]|uniref:helicase-associated domain-containing protein n=1 Tax=Paractinoplanes maris TaxID=1734446 RepID=UPI0020206286|nr:helicase-associated domain-containing protein [Actinoplanes maris]